MKDDINGLIFCGILFVVLLYISILLRSGRGAMLINGYNIMSKERKAMYNEKALCRFFGNLLLFADLYLILVVIVGVYGITWLVITLTLLLIAVSFGSTIFAFTSSRFKNNLK